MSGEFRYANPARIIWGEGSVGRLRALVGELGARRALIVTAAHLADSAADPHTLFPDGGAPEFEVAVVQQHAPAAQVEAAVRSRCRRDVDVVISYGGGSPIDAAKLIARPDGGRLARLPHLAVPTTLSVAELSSRAGFTDASGDKAGVNDRAMMPAAVIYDPVLTTGTPQRLWLSSGIRAVDHAVEGFLAPGEHPLSDVLAVEAIRRLERLLPVTLADPADLPARAGSQVAAWFSYTLPDQAMVGLSHRMGKQIGARHGIPHGVTSCLLLPHVMRLRAELDPGRSAALDAALRDGGDRSSTAADRVEALIERLGLPRHAAEYGLSETDAERAAKDLEGEHSAARLLGVYRKAL